MNYSLLLNCFVTCDWIFSDSPFSLTSRTTSARRSFSLSLSFIHSTHILYCALIQRFSGVSDSEMTDFRVWRTFCEVGHFSSGKFKMNGLVGIFDNILRFLKVLVLVILSVISRAFLMSVLPKNLSFPNLINPRTSAQYNCRQRESSKSSLSTRLSFWAKVQLRICVNKSWA